MKIFLIKLTHGVIEADLKQDEKELLHELDAKGFLKRENDVYVLNSKYRAGLIDTTQTGAGFLQVIGTSMKDLYIEAKDLKGAEKDDLVIAQRLIGKRGQPAAVVAFIVGKAEHYGVAYIKLVNNAKALTDLKTDTPTAIRLESHTLDTYKENDLFQRESTK